MGRKEQVAIKFTGDTLDALRAWQEMREQPNKMGDELEKTGKRGKKAGDNLTASFESAAIALASVGAAATAAKLLISQMNAESSKAKDSKRTISDATSLLNTVATSAEDSSRMTARADRLASRFGTDRVIARELSFSARSEGFEKFLPELLEGGREAFGGQEGLRAAGTAAGQVPGLFKGSGLTPGQAVNMLLAASKDSRATFQEITQAAPAAAQGGSIAGSSPSETFGLLSVLPSKDVSAAETSTRLKLFGVRVGTQGEFDDRLKGKGILGGFRAVRDEFSPDERKKFLGEGRGLNTLFKDIGDLEGEIVNRIAEIKVAGAGESLIKANLKQRFESDQDALDERRSRAAKNIEEIRNEKFAGVAFRRETAGSMARSEVVDASPVVRTAVSATTHSLEFLGASPEAIQREALGADQSFGSIGGTPTGRATFGEDGTPRFEFGGTKNINITLRGPDGADIPHEVEVGHTSGE